MKIIVDPAETAWKELLKRPYSDNAGVMSDVQTVLKDIKRGGDHSVVNYAEQFDKVVLDDLRVPAADIEAAQHEVLPELKDAIILAAGNIEAFHTKQLLSELPIETVPGVQCWRRSVAIEKVGLYIPGGTAPLFSTVLMLGIPARLAGCKEIILCTPCDKDGRVHPAILFAAKLVGISTIFRIGGSQAIAAMAYGTESVPAVYKIFGPGNQYVTAAKQLVQMEGVAIDMPAGPSEVCVLADETANPVFVAADLLSQAEHGRDSQVLLISTSEKMVNACLAELERQLKELPRKEIAERSLSHSRAVIMPDLQKAISFVNAYAAEHLIICCKEADQVAGDITNAGSVFIGNYSPESAGDYASGTNHTLPTNGFARAYSGVSVDSFVKKITYQKLTREGLQNIGPAVVLMAEAEGLEGHAAAVRKRLQT
jgi:histidinol dehydrogenase